MIKCMVTVGAAVVLLLPSMAVALKVEIHAGKTDRMDTPVRIVLPEKVQAAHFRVGDALLVAETFGQMKLLHVVVSIKAGQTLKLELHPVDRVSRQSRMQCVANDQHITLAQGDRRVLQYNRVVVSPPKGAKPTHARSGFVHPVFTPNGRTVTNAFPQKHWHHYGLWFPWRKTEFEGNEVNFWETGGGQATIRFAKLLGHGQDHHAAWFHVAHEHVVLKRKGGPKAALNETWRVRAYAHKSINLFDIESDQITAGNLPLTIKKYYYGGFGMRGSKHWEGDAVAFLTSEGKTRKDGNFTAAKWTSMSGQLAGKPAGIAILCHPDNFRFPQKTRLHPKEPFFCYVPGMDKPFTIKPGDTFASRYRFVVHDGEVNAKLIERLWQDYANPPKVVVKP